VVRGGVMCDVIHVFLDGVNVFSIKLLIISFGKYVLPVFSEYRFLMVSNLVLLCLRYGTICFVLEPVILLTDFHNCFGFSLSSIADMRSCHVFVYSFRQALCS
jgi:hypothetical protein